MPLSGQFLQQKRARDPSQAVLHQADPSHFEAGQVEQQDPATWEAPQYHEAAPGPNALGYEFVTRAPGLQLPEAPFVDGHEHAPGHGHDDGGRDGRNRQDVRWQHSDESYEVDAFDGLPGEVSSLPLIVHQRGLNAEGPNNPPDASYGGEGFRRGHYRQWNLRRLMRPPWRVHDQRVVSAWTATVIGDAPPPDNPGPYNAPFSSLARVQRQLFDRPQMRRIPPGFDEAVVTDGSEPSPPTPDLSGAGLGSGVAF